MHLYDKNKKFIWIMEKRIMVLLYGNNLSLTEGHVYCLLEFFWLVFSFMKLTRYRSNSLSDHKFKDQRIVREKPALLHAQLTWLKLKCLWLHRLYARTLHESPFSYLNSIHPDAQLLEAKFLISTSVDSSKLPVTLSSKILMFERRKTHNTFKLSSEHK